MAPGGQRQRPQCYDKRPAPNSVLHTPSEPQFASKTADAKVSGCTIYQPRPVVQSNLKQYRHLWGVANELRIFFSFHWSHDRPSFDASASVAVRLFAADQSVFARLP